MNVNERKEFFRQLFRKAHEANIINELVSISADSVPRAVIRKIVKMVKRKARKDALKELALSEDDIKEALFDENGKQTLKRYDSACFRHEELLIEAVGLMCYLRHMRKALFRKFQLISIRGYGSYEARQEVITNRPFMPGKDRILLSLTPLQLTATTLSGVNAIDKALHKMKFGYKDYCTTEEKIQFLDNCYKLVSQVEDEILEKIHTTPFC